MVLPIKGRKRRACCKHTVFLLFGKLRRPPTCSVVWPISVQQLGQASTYCTEGKTTTYKREGRVVAITAVLADGGDGGRSPFERRQKSKVFYYIFVLLWGQSASLSCMHGYESMGALLCCRYVHKYIRGVLGNKCAGQPNLKTVYFTETST